MPLYPPSTQNPGSYNPSLWALQNPWFRNCSSLAGALGDQGPGAPTSRPVPPSFGMHTPVPFGCFWGYPGQHTPNVTIQGVMQALLLEPGTSDRIFEDDWGGADGTGGSNDRDCDCWTVAGLRGEVPIFCRVGDCHYWHTDLRQVKRHRDTHFEHRYGFVCPNQATCPSRGGDFRRRDAVGVHCKKSLLCGDALRATGGRIQHWGTPATEEDLCPYDPNFHIPYKKFNGRTGRGGGKVAKICRC